MGDRLFVDGRPASPYLALKGETTRFVKLLTREEFEADPDNLDALGSYELYMKATELVYRGLKFIDACIQKYKTNPEPFIKHWRGMGLIP